MLMFSDVGGSGQWQWKVSRAEIRLGAILIFENQMIINSLHWAGGDGVAG